MWEKQTHPRISAIAYTAQMFGVAKQMAVGSVYKATGLWWPWRNFSRLEMACHHCGEEYYWPEFMDRLQQARALIAKPMVVNSAHRCALYNARIGGAPLSQHLKLAADIALRGQDRGRLFEVCKQAGFRGFGFYETFLHIDLGAPRHWYGSRKAKELW